MRVRSLPRSGGSSLMYRPWSESNRGDGAWPGRDRSGPQALAHRGLHPASDGVDGGQPSQLPLQLLCPSPV